ncbi:hypothetical protein [Marmoricola endophyticus]|uniref:hypothetical protein n=1 Tax=Marmoricola endophyticus TaxID=2040280 RepID=UPI0016639FEA|nr:hypothetical protein [Marmoricola endophyticus]
MVATATAAPAMAASCSTQYAGTLDWASNYTRSSATSGTASVPVGAAGNVGVTLSSTFTGYTAYTQTPPNLSSYSPVGGTGAAGLSLVQTANSASVTNNSANNQTLTMTFNRPVYSLSFLITDLDYNANQYRDGMAVTSTAAYTTTVPSGSTVVGAGTTASPFQSSASAAYDNNTGTAGNIRLTFAGPVNSVQFIYWNLLPPAQATATALNQGAWISNMTLTARNPNCA